MAPTETEYTRRERISDAMLEANKHGDVTDALRRLVDDLHRDSFDGTVDLSLAVLVLARSLDATRAELEAHYRDCPHIEPPHPYLLGNGGLSGSLS